MEHPLLAYLHDKNMMECTLPQSEVNLHPPQTTPEVKKSATLHPIPPRNQVFETVERMLHFNPKVPCEPDQYHAWSDKSLSPMPLPCQVDAIAMFLSGKHKSIFGGQRMSIDALQSLVKTSKVLRLSADDGEHMLYSMDTATSVFTLVLDGQVKVKSLPPHSTFTHFCWSVRKRLILWLFS
jgi:hypothetical protein